MRLAVLLSCLVIFAVGTSTAQSTVEVELTEDVVLTWDNETSKYVENKSYKKIKEDISDYRSVLVGMIDDTTSTTAYICAHQSEVTNGMLAFALLDQIDRIPYAKVFEIQFCVVVFGCPFPDGLMYYIYSRRDEAQQKLETHYRRSRKHR